MMLAAVISLLWSVWVVFMVLEPNAVANFLMQSYNWDDGRFWLIPDNRSHVRTAGVAGLVVVAAGYSYVILKMTIWRFSQPSLLPSAFVRLERIVEAVLLKGSFGTRITRILFRGWRDLTGYRGVYRKYWVSVSTAFDGDSGNSHILLF